jgi:transposase-like protein
VIACKGCGSCKTVKNGKVREQARYKCKDCALNFIEGDRRVKESLVVKKALAVMMYSLGKASFGMIGKILGYSRSLIYRWIVEEAAKIPEPPICETIQEMEFDEMWHFIQKKRTKSGFSKPWIVVQGELSPGLQVIVMLQRLDDSTTK